MNKQSLSAAFDMTNCPSASEIGFSAIGFRDFMTIIELLEAMTEHLARSPEAQKIDDAAPAQADLKKLLLSSREESVPLRPTKIQIEYRSRKFIRKKATPTQKRNQEFDRLLAQGYSETQAATIIAQSNDPDLKDKKLKTSTVIQEHRPPKKKKKK